jgi:hypothetical protein
MKEHLSREEQPEQTALHFSGSSEQHMSENHKHKIRNIFDKK